MHIIAKFIEDILLVLMYIIIHTCTYLRYEDEGHYHGRPNQETHTGENSKSVDKVHNGERKDENDNQ